MSNFLKDKQDVHKKNYVQIKTEIHSYITKRSRQQESIN